MTDLPEANWITVVGKNSDLKKITDAWADLTDSEQLRDTPPLRIFPFPEGMKQYENSDSGPVRIAEIEHAPGIGKLLLDHLNTGLEEKLGMTPGQVVLEPGYYIETADW